VKSSIVNFTPIAAANRQQVQTGTVSHPPSAIDERNRVLERSVMMSWTNAFFDQNSKTAGPRVRSSLVFH